MKTSSALCFVEVAVDGVLPGPDGATLTYGCDRNIAPGTLVWVPIRRSVALGAVLGAHRDEPPFEVRPVLDVVDGYALTHEQIDLGAWLARETASDLFSCFALMMPPGVKHSVTPWFRLTSPRVQGQTRMQQQVIEHLRANGSVSLEGLQNEIGSSLSTVLADLERAGSIVRTYTSDVHTVQARSETWWVDASGEHPPKLTARQAELFRVVHTAGPAGMRANEARDRASASAAIGTKLLEMGVIRAESRPLAAEIDLDPVGTLPQLTQEQSVAWEGLDRAIGQGSTTPQLLFGVTGSGKTELYLRAIARVLREGKQAIYLVPEIALSGPTATRVRERFPGQVAVIHSGLAMGARQEMWESVVAGERRIVVGTRSALLTPVPNLGLIVIDEEHDTSYKQDATPRYDARPLAEELARRTGATLILGSATPRIETLWRANEGEVELYRLGSRAVAAARELPPVEIVDIRQELQAGHTALLCRSLEGAIERALSRREQTMLLLNRRGTATVVLCRDCGLAMNCPNCAIPLVYHKDRGSLICHRCDHRERPLADCPKCGGPLDYFGAGTQRVESEVKRRFPAARVLRWDQDTARRRGANAAILKSIEDRQVDIIIGTQLIAKGLDLPYVTTVGIISADVGLHFPDFRSGERTFQLVTQMAGRAGRRTPASAVIVQTYSPDHYVLQAARTHDVLQFYRNEIAFREQHRYPPFVRLVRYLVRGATDEECAIACDGVVRQLGRLARDNGVEIEIVGPAPAFVARVRGEQQWHVVVKTAPESLEMLLDRLPNPPGWTVDIDPVSLL
ncbi:MAG: primosomal protein N' [Chloroflexota bacterium]|nr:primosomal protein N' [Chloroflexota bacterium]